jgi:hypothetical protein
MLHYVQYQWGTCRKPSCINFLYIFYHLICFVDYRSIGKVSDKVPHRFVIGYHSTLLLGILPTLSIAVYSDPSYSGVSRDFMLVGPHRGLIKVCFSTPKLGGSGGMLPQEIFEKLALTRSILVHSGPF